MKKSNQIVMKIMKTFLFISSFLFLFSPLSFATEETHTDDIIESQKQTLNIGGFIEEAKKYTEE